VVVGDFNIPLSPIDSHPDKKINKEILELNNTTDQMDLTDVYRIFHPATAQYTFFSATQNFLQNRPQASLKNIRKLK
jgi:exonuclease III